MDERIKVLEEKMQKAYDFLNSELATIRAGRANPHVLDKVRVDYYGTPTPIQQVGNVTVPEPRILQIAPIYCDGHRFPSTGMRPMKMCRQTDRNRVGTYLRCCRYDIL